MMFEIDTKSGSSISDEHSFLILDIPSLLNLHLKWKEAAPTSGFQDDGLSLAIAGENTLDLTNIVVQLLYPHLMQKIYW